VLERSGDLWRLLAGITLNKLHHQIERNTAKKRDVGKDCAITADQSVTVRTELASREPTADEAVALAEEVEFLMRGFEPLHRQVIELRLQGFLVEEIAQKTNRKQWPVLGVGARIWYKLHDRAADMAAR
jgi:hypothetical protein